MTAIGLRHGSGVLILVVLDAVADLGGSPAAQRDDHAPVDFQRGRHGHPSGHRRHDFGLEDLSDRTTSQQRDLVEGQVLGHRDTASKSR